MPDTPIEDAKYITEEPAPTLHKVVRGGDKLKGVAPELLNHWNALQDEFDAAGIVPTIKSGYRTAGQQHSLFTNPATHARTKGNDGYINISPHQEGRALDIAFNTSQKAKGRQIIADYAKRAGLHVPGDEPWHIAIPKAGQQAPQDEDSKYISTSASPVDDDAKYISDGNAVVSATPPVQLAVSRTTGGTSDNPYYDDEQGIRRYYNSSEEMDAAVAQHGSKQVRGLNQQVRASQDTNEQLAHDIKWHFGTGMLYHYGKLDAAKQREIAKLATSFRKSDEAKHSRGEDITKSLAWQLQNQRRVGLIEGRDYEARTSPEVDAAQRQQWNESTAALSAAGNPLLSMPRTLRAVDEPVSKGLAGIARFGAGVSRAASEHAGDFGAVSQGVAAVGRFAQPKFEQAANFYGEPPAEAEAAGQAPAVQQRMSEMGYAEQAAKAAPFGRKTRIAQGLGQGVVEFAPLMALGHPEGILASMGTGAATFGGYTAAQRYGEGATPEEAFKEGAKAAPFGALMGLPTRALGTVVDSELRNAVTSVGLKGIGYYGIGRAEGMSPQEAAENATTLTAFAAPELAGAVTNALVGRATRGPVVGPSLEGAANRPMESAVKSAIESAFEVARVSPEAAEKALKTAVVAKPAQPVEARTALEVREKLKTDRDAELTDHEQAMLNTLIGAEASEGLAKTARETGRVTSDWREQITPEQHIADLEAEAKQRRTKLAQLEERGQATELNTAPLNSSRGTASAIGTAVVLDGSRYVRSGADWLYNGEQRVTSPETIAKLNAKLESQRGSFSNRPKDKMKLAPLGVKAGAVDDLEFPDIKISDEQVAELNKRMARMTPEDRKNAKFQLGEWARNRHEAIEDDVEAVHGQIVDLGDIDIQPQLPESTHLQADIAANANDFVRESQLERAMGGRDFTQPRRAPREYTQTEEYERTLNALRADKFTTEQAHDWIAKNRPDLAGTIMDEVGAQDLGDVDKGAESKSVFAKLVDQLQEDFPEASKEANQVDAREILQARHDLPPWERTVDALLQEHPRFSDQEIIKWLRVNRPDHYNTVPASQWSRIIAQLRSSNVQDFTHSNIDAGPLGLTNKWKKQRGALGEPPEKPKPAPLGVKTGAVEDRAKAEPIIGIVGPDGVVRGKADPARNLDHGRVFPEAWSTSEHWHYEPSTETIYWTGGDSHVSLEAKHAAENFLDRKGLDVKRHSNYTSYIQDIRDIETPELTEEELLAQIFHPEAQDEHPSASQPRTPETGQFAAANDHEAIAKEIAGAGQRMKDDYARLTSHPARRDLASASSMAVRNYFRQLYTFVSTHAPEKLSLVRQAENAQYSGDLVKATVLSERALSSSNDSNLPKTLKDARTRAIRAERWKGQEGAIGERPEPPKPGPEGIRTGTVADREAERREKERSLPKHLTATEREPGEDTTYLELPNKVTQARVEKRIATEGIEATEAWYNKQETEHPEAGAELTDAFRQLSDHYLTKLANATEPAEIASLTAKAKQLAGTEAPRSTGLGQAVQAYAMLDHYTGPEVLLEAARLAERVGESLPDAIIADIAKTGQEFKEADTKLAEIRKELVKTEREVGLGAGKGAGKGLGTGTASARRIEQLRDQQTKLVEARQAAKIRQERTLSQLERKPTALDYLTKFNNIIRGFMVSAIPTAVRNYETQGLRFGAERLVDLFALGMRKARGQDPHISGANIHRDLMRLFQSESRSKAVNIAGEYPNELRRLFATYGGGQVETAQAARTFAGRVERAFGGVERFVQSINWLNQLQEFHIRGAEFLSHMDMLVERKHNMTLEQFMREKGADALSKEMIKDSVDHALEVTFADLPATDTRIGQYMKSAISFGNLIPPTVSPIPFARWFYNSWKFNYQFSPLGLADLARTPRQLREARRALQRIEVRPPAKTEATATRRQVELEKARANVARLTENAKIERYRTVAKAAIGTAFLGTAYAARSSKLAGEKWYEMYIPGTDQLIDARPFAPFSTYLFVAEGIRRSIHGERPFSKNEFYAALGASTSATGGMEVLYDKYRRGDFDSLMRALQTEGADLGTAVLTPVRQIRDVLGQFDKSQATTYDTSTQPGLGPIKASLPYGERLGKPLPPAYKPTSDEPIHATNPITKFLGPRIITPKNFVEHEADRLRFDFNEVRPATDVPAIDQLEEQWMGEFVGRWATKLANNPNYAHQPDSAKAELYLKPLFAAGRTYARARLASEHPDLYLKLIERSKSARQRAMEKDLGVKQIAEPY